MKGDHYKELLRVMMREFKELNEKIERDEWTDYPKILYVLDHINADLLGKLINYDLFQLELTELMTQVVSTQIDLQKALVLVYKQMTPEKEVFTFEIEKLIFIIKQYIKYLKGEDVKE